MNPQNEQGDTPPLTLPGGRMPARLRQAALAIVLTLSVVGLVARANLAEAADEPRETAVPVRVRSAALVERAAIVSASGSVEASATADVGFQVGGRVARVLVEEGQLVRAGQLLAAIEPNDYALALRQYEAGAAQATDEFQRMRELHDKGSLAPNDYRKFEAAAEASVAQAALARERLEDTRLVSPIAGTIVRRSIDAGEMAAAGVPVFTIVAMDPVEVRVGIPEAQVGLVRPGATTTIAIPALPGGSFEARVTMLGVSADPASRTYPVKIAIPNGSRTLLPGMIAEAHIHGDRIVRALTVPGDAIVRDADGATLVYVYAPAEQRVYGRRVSVGMPIDREVEITQGLEPGDLVVIGGQDRMRDGMAVIATEERPASDSTTGTRRTAGRAEDGR